MKAKAIILSLLSIFLGVFVTQSDASAWVDPEGAVHLVASPSIDKLGTLEPGKSYTRTISLTNNSEKDITFMIKPLSFKAKDDNYSYVWGISDSQYSKIADWTDIDSDKTRTLSPGESEQFNYTISIPQDQTGGAQHMMVSVQILNDEDQEDTMIQAETLLNLQVYSNIAGDLDARAHLISQEIPSFSFNPIIRTVSVIENIGNVNLDINYSVKIIDAISGKLAYEASTEKVLMPESKRIVEQNWDGAPLLGLFNTYQEITYINEDGEKTVATLEKLVFICPIWLILVVVAMLVLFVLAIIFNRKKKKANSIR